MAKDKPKPNFDAFIDDLLGKNIVKEPLPKQESFDDFIDGLLGKNDTKKK